MKLSKTSEALDTVLPAESRFSPNGHHGHHGRNGFGPKKSLPPLAARALKIKVPLAILALVAVAGAAALGVRIERVFTATAQVSLPMQASVDSSTPIDSAALLADSLQKVQSEGFNAPEAHMEIGAAPDSSKVLITVRAQDAAGAAELANSAAQNLVARDHKLWSKAISQPGAARMTLNAQIATMDQAADRTATAQSAQYLVTAAPAGAPFAFEWLELMVIVGLMLLLFTPDGQSAAVEHGSPLMAAGALDAHMSGAPLDEIPSLAGVLLTRDLTSPGQLGVRPVLTDVDVTLWGWFTGHLKSEGAEAQEGDDAVRRVIAREFLMTRADAWVRGVAAATLALGRELAKRGITVAIVDADVTATKAQRAELGLPENMPGLTEILSGNYKLDECLLEEEDYPGLQAVTAGMATLSGPDDAARLLSSTAFLDLLDRLNAMSGVVLIHGPSVALAAKTIAPRVDATLLACSEDQSESERASARSAAAVLHQARANLIGRIEICAGNIVTTAS